MELWDQTGNVLRDNLTADDEALERFRHLAQMAQTMALELNGVCNQIIVSWTFTHLTPAKTERELLIYQSLVVALRQIQNVMHGKIFEKVKEPEPDYGRDDDRY